MAAYSNQPKCYVQFGSAFCKSGRSRPIPVDGNPGNREVVVAQGQVGGTSFFVEGKAIVTRTQSAVDFGGSPLSSLSFT